MVGGLARPWSHAQTLLSYADQAPFCSVTSGLSDDGKGADMSSTAWQAYRRKAQVVRDVLARLDATSGDELPWDAATAEVFADRGELLRELQQVWSRRLAARVDLALESGDAEDGVAAAWQELARELPGLRRVLDSHESHPALRHGVRTEHRLLGVAAGHAALDDPPWYAAHTGARLTGSVPTPAA